MKTMKIWRLTFVMLAAFSFVSCSSDDDEEFLIDQLTGTWQQVYDEGVVAEGYVQYTFTPGTPANVGKCTIYVYDVFTGDATFVRDYVLTEDRHLAIYKKNRGRFSMIRFRSVYDTVADTRDPRYLSNICSIFT